MEKIPGYETLWGKAAKKIRKNLTADQKTETKPIESSKTRNLAEVLFLGAIGAATGLALKCHEYWGIEEQQFISQAISGTVEAGLYYLAAGVIGLYVEKGIRKDTQRRYEKIKSPPSRITSGLEADKDNMRRLGLEKNSELEKVRLGTEFQDPETGQKNWPDNMFVGGGARKLKEGEEPELQWPDYYK